MKTKIKSRTGKKTNFRGVSQLLNEAIVDNISLSDDDVLRLDVDTFELEIKDFNNEFCEGDKITHLLYSDKIRAKIIFSVDDIEYGDVSLVRMKAIDLKADKCLK